MIRKHVHCHRERQNMSTHEEDQKEQLPTPQQLSSERAHEHFACVRHARDMRVSPFELPQPIISTGNNTIVVVVLLTCPIT